MPGPDFIPVWVGAALLAIWLAGLILIAFWCFGCLIAEVLEDD